MPTHHGGSGRAAVPEPAPRESRSAPERHVCLQFDMSRPYGSAEHYHHFLLGYLLPCVHVIGEMELDRPAKEGGTFVWHLRSCGPVMDKLLDEVLSAMGVRHEVAGRCARAGTEVITVPRFDRWFAGIRWLPARQRSHALCRQMMAAARRCAASLDGGEPSRTREGSYLIIRRSEQPEYYRRGGPAEIAGYGTARRSLRDIDAVTEQLQRRGIDVEAFEPGQCTLAAQIDAFRRCRGVIAIRGAELANIVWMRPGSEVLMFHPPMAFARAPEAALAALAGVHLTDMPVRDPHHRIDTLGLERMLRDPPRRTPWAWASIRRTVTASIARLP